MEAKTEPREFKYRWPFYPVISKKLSPKTREGVVPGFSPRDKLHGQEHGVPLLAHVRYIKIITCLRDLISTQTSIFGLGLYVFNLGL